MADNMLKFLPMETIISPSFWFKLAEIKLDVDRLSDTEKRIYGELQIKNVNLKKKNQDIWWAGTFF